MKCFKKIKGICLGLFIVLLVGSVAGCIGGTKTSSVHTGEVPTIKYFLPWDPGSPEPNGKWIIRNWEEKTRVKFEITTITRDIFKEKLAAMLASGNLPDLINYYQDDKTCEQYGSKLFVPLDEYLDNGKLPNLKVWLDKYPDVAEMSKSLEDGKIYGFPRIQDYDVFNSAWTIREDVLKKGGMKAEDIKTLDDLKRALLILKKESGQPYVTSSRMGWSYFPVITGYFFGTSPNMMLDNRTADGTSKFIYGPTGKMYKEWIEFYKWMYENGILHPNFATMQQQELFAGYEDGKFTLCMEQAAMGGMLGGNFEPKHPEREEKFVNPVAINGEIPKQPLMAHNNNGYRWPVTVSKSSKNIDACMTAMDWLYSQEGFDSMSRGEPYVDWEYDDDFIMGYKFTSKFQHYEGTQKLKRGEITQEQFNNLPLITNECIGDAWLVPLVSTGGRFSWTDKPKSETRAMFSYDNVQKWIEAGNVLPPDPVVKFTRDENETIAEILTPLDTYVSEQSIKFIMGTVSMNEWGAFQAKIKELGSDKLAKMYNK